MTTRRRTFRGQIVFGSVRYHAKGLTRHHGEMVAVTVFEDGSAQAQAGQDIYPLERMA